MADFGHQERPGRFKNLYAQVLPEYG